MSKQQHSIASNRLMLGFMGGCCIVQTQKSDGAFASRGVDKGLRSIAMDGIDASAVLLNLLPPKQLPKTQVRDQDVLLLR